MRANICSIRLFITMTMIDDVIMLCLSLSDLMLCLSLSDLMLCLSLSDLMLCLSLSDLMLCKENRQKDNYMKTNLG
jgi:hypothetical protein